MPPIDYRAVSEVHFIELDRYLQAYLAKGARLPFQMAFADPPQLPQTRGPPLARS
jgi:hypothetical protein